MDYDIYDALVELLFSMRLGLGFRGDVLDLSIDYRGSLKVLVALTPCDMRKRFIPLGVSHLLGSSRTNGDSF